MTYINQTNKRNKYIKINTLINEYIAGKYGKRWQRLKALKIPMIVRGSSKPRAKLLERAMDSYRVKPDRWEALLEKEISSAAAQHWILPATSNEWNNQLLSIRSQAGSCIKLQVDKHRRTLTPRLGKTGL